MKKIIVCFIVSLMANNIVFAQKDWVEPADRTFKAKNFFDAIPLYKKAYSKEKDKAKKSEILFKIAECSRLTSDPKSAEPYYAKAISAKYADAIVYLRYAEVLQANGNYPEAIIQYNKFKQEVPSDTRGDDGAKACEMAQKWKDHPSRYVVRNFAEINSKFSDLAVGYSNVKKGYTAIVFSSAREEATGKDFDASWSGEKNTDLFETIKDKKDRWSTPTPLAAPVSTEEKEGSPSFNRKGVIMYYTQCGKQKGKIVACKLYYANRKGTAWDAPVMLPFCEKDSMAYGHPSLSADEQYLYFSSNREGGQGGYDIWVSEYNKKAKEWNEPVNLGPTINTVNDEFFPFVHADGTLYFASNGHLAEGNMGGVDIFSATFNKEKNQWVNVKNMQSPINSAFDDYAIIWEDEDQKGFFTSNRDGGKGKDDIYLFYIKPLVFTLQGQVFDIDTKLPLPGSKVELNCTTDGNILSVIADKTGFYKYVLKQNNNYTVTASKEGYLSAKGTETTMNLEDSKDFIRDFYLKSHKREIVLPNILYGLDSFNLRSESRVSLDELVTTLNNNPQIVIELGSHTDTRATHEYNVRLSQNRAQSVVDYLISKGIEKERVVARGYSFDVPRKLQKNETWVVNGKDYTFKEGETMTPEFINAIKTEDEKEAAHQLNRRTEFKVLRDNYVPKKGKVEVAPVDTTGSTTTSRSITPVVTDDTNPVKTEEKAEETNKEVAPVAPVVEPMPEGNVYTSEKGDTYASIAEKFGLKVDDLKQINEIVKGNKPKVGTILKLVDDKKYHDVVKGDTFQKIAKLYGIKVDEMKKWNNIDKELIKEFYGKKLIVGKGK